MKFTILYEDNDIVAIDKPAGLMTHPDGRSTEETASDWFAATYPESKEVGETQKLQDGSEITRPGVVHRLDRETSGVLIFTKTAEAHAWYKEQFKEHTVQKTYIAFIYGVPKERKGVIDFPIGRSTQDFRRRSAQPGAKGILREALTRWERIGDTGTHSLLKVLPETGRTHQIRVHLKAIHHPIVGDALYAPNRPSDLGFTRLGLHAHEIELPTPSGTKIHIVSPLPEDLAQAAKRFSFAE